MAKNTNLSEAYEFSEQNAQRATQIAMSGMNWMREITEQNLNQNRIAFEGCFKATRNAIEGISRQMSELGQRSMSIAEETLSNSFDFAHRAMRAREPQELAQLQNEFVSRQAQILADQAKEAGETMMQNAREVASSASRRVPEAHRRSEAGRSEAA